MLPSEPMTSELRRAFDARTIATLLISRFGEQAYAHASHQALKARERGDRQLMEGWRWVAGAVAALLRSEPDGQGGGPS
jgi:hypothetical protein